MTPALRGRYSFGMTQTTDPRNVYLNPKGVPGIISRYEPFVDDEPLIRTPEPRVRPANTDLIGTVNGVPGVRYGTTEPRRNRVDPDLEAQVPAGRYAIATPNGVRFYRVDKPSKGNWKGWTFVKVQASDDLHPVRSVAQRTDVLRAIAIDPRAASERYGRELGVCGVCGRTLTDEASRARGIGPICESKF